ncbi:hypothetical protein M407DRAFT_20433 [Tulasnella calospora MUT 4182]|uniref:UvrD-like helicase ATP-binding domain-containing protein n=1 Tax=Tulasnella calospora MUT 4182 TaxID=1051891 RepID=A0A0C3QG47_9AGAM|nr:hypothetical protein M407DRAFT_20433 [Tulasnella calospora MUT 4182]
MDFSDALASFRLPETIDSPRALDDAISNLLEALGAAEADIVSLLSTLAYDIHGILEVILTSRSDNAFIFRSRIIKTLQKSSGTPHAIFTLCAERVGAFLVGLPPGEIVLDRTVLETYGAFTASLRASKPSDAEVYTSKKTKTPVKSQPKVNTKKKRNTTWVNLSIQIPENENEDENENDKDLPDSPPDIRSPTSPIIPTTASSKKANLLEQVRECLEIFFGSCAEEAIEDWAVNNLLNLLKTKDVSQPNSPLISKQSAPSSPIIEKALAQSPVKSRFTQTPYASLGPSDIARYLQDAASSKFGEWPVVVSQRGIKHLRQYLEANKDVFVRIEKKIKQLSVGFFSAPNHTKLLGKDQGIPIYTAELGGDLCLLYHIDFGAPTGSSQESQFIRIFGVFSMPDIDTKFWKSVAAQLARRGPEYVQRCEERADSRLRSKGGKQIRTTPPKLSPPLATSHWKPEGADAEIDESHFLELHRILALEKFVPLSQSFFDAIQKFDETSFMFAVSSPEYRIIKHPSSCLVLGRSGTGKTTCMLFRMICLDIAAEKYNRPFRQMFVTKSSTLARRVRSYCIQLRQTEANEAGTAPREKAPGLSLLEMDETAEEEGVLPSKFSELQDSHFPLFLTYDQLCRLLEADCELHFNPSSLTSVFSLPNQEQNASTRQPLISFDYFESLLWPHFDERLTKGLHAALVYSEFMGVIKGSEASLSKSRRYLDRDTYETLSSRTHSGDDTERSRIYTLFEAYQKQRPSGSYDVADRVHALLEALQTKGLKGKYVDFLYVDEAQDNLIVDAALLRSLCQNPHGLFFAGDTAQTISVGSAFRFSELKAFLYRLERDDPSVKRDIRRAIDPQFFQLSTNYRSHSGIVNVAAFVVGLLNQYFPHSIDSLTPEVSLVDVSAHKPVFFSGREDGSDFRRLISDSKSGKVELGAHQVIIVRDDAAAKKLQTDFGRVGVILTLYESKGMEFDDVLLYDFFTDSTATATDWRAILLSQHEGRIFDERRHSILQSELKSFYVGLTRARERVWIWDSSRKGQDMESLLVTSLLANAYDADQTVPQLGASSTPEEWAKQAQQYFSKRLFGEANFCFKKAGMDWWASVALAYADRQVASRLSEKHPRRRPAFLEVARNFDRLAQQAGSFDDANNAQLLFINAAECFIAIPDHASAAHSFFKGSKFTQAAYHYRMAGKFDEAIDVIKAHSVDAEIATSIEYAAKFIYTRKRDVPSLHKAWKICESKEEFLEFLDDHGFEEQRIQFLDSITEHEEVGDVFWKAGNYVDAISRYQRSKKPSAAIKCVNCLLAGLRSNITFGSQPGKTTPVISKLLGLSQQLSLNPEQRTEVSLFQAIVRARSSDILSLGRLFFEQAESRGALLALDAWIHSGNLKGLKVDAIDSVADILLACRQYCYVINVLVQRPELLEKPATQQLLGISSINDEGAEAQDVASNRRVHPQSFIYSKLFKASEPHSKATDPLLPLTLPKDAVNDTILHALLDRKNNILISVHQQALHSGAFGLCSGFITTGRCNTPVDRRCWRAHMPSDSVSIESFNFRFRLHLLMIALLDQFAAVKGGYDENERNRANIQRIWLGRIFDLCYPETTKTGNLSDVTPELIPEYQELIPIFKSWLQETFLALRPSAQPRFFLGDLMKISLLANAVDYAKSKVYFQRGQWFLDHVTARREGLYREGRPVAGTALTWFSRHTGSRHYFGVYAIQHMIERKLAIDVDVATAYIEEVSGQMILNHYMYYMSSSYDGMTMPRSWIIRALMQQSSYVPNGGMPHVLVLVLGSLLETLVGRSNSGKLHQRGSPLWKTGPLPFTTIRICRCLALLGINIPKLNKEVLQALQPLKFLTAVSHTELLRFSSAAKWAHVEDALLLSMVSSRMDDLVTVIMPPRRVAANPSRPRYVMCSNDEELLRKLLIGPRIPLAAPLLLPKPAAKPRGPAQGIPAASSAKVQDIKADEPKSGNHSAEGPVQMEGLDYTDKHNASASIIRRLFLHHRRRAGGPVCVAFEQLVKRLLQDQNNRPGRFLILCLRGPLPHVLALLYKLRDASQVEITALNKAMQASKHEDLDELHARGKDIRGIRNTANKLIRDLQPSSAFYNKWSSGGIVLVFEIVEKVKSIPELITALSKFTSFPSNLDYDLGVEPLLSDRVPWAPKKPTAKKDSRPTLNTDDLDGYDDY